MENKNRTRGTNKLTVQENLHQNRQENQQED